MLSVIIVSYNVKDYLLLCLRSVEQAALSCPGGVEIIVVDNASSDGSAAAVAAEFPAVRLEMNTENTGFSKACNQGFQNASGEFLLFLNPDTLLPPDSLEKCLAIIERDMQIGALGIRMVDESGRFLKESIRGFPGPRNSFFKLFGFARLFPKSAFFAGYYLGHLDKSKDQEAEVLSGAFMLVRSSVFRTLSGFDERFFMYAEDIDLSYRIRQTGFRNYYFAGSTITHYKGKSTKKGRKYRQHFYGAMILFVQKHYGKKSLRSLFLQAGIILRSFLERVGSIFTSGEDKGN